MVVSLAMDCLEATENEWNSSLSSALKENKRSN